MKVIFWIALILLVVGWVNRGLVWFFNFDLVATIFGPMSTLSKIVYDVVWVSALYVLIAKLSWCACSK